MKSIPYSFGTFSFQDTVKQLALNLSKIGYKYYLSK